MNYQLIIGDTLYLNANLTHDSLNTHYSTLSPGLYFLTIQNNNTYITHTMAVVVDSVADCYCVNYPGMLVLHTAQNYSNLTPPVGTKIYVHNNGGGQLNLGGINIFEGCEFIFEQDVMLALAPNSNTLIANNDTLQAHLHACPGASWKGIRHLDNGAVLKIQGTSKIETVLIEDAVNAVRTNNYLQASFRFVKFDRNQTALWLPGYPATAAGYEPFVTGCTFTCSSPLNDAFAPNTLKHGIHLSNIQDSAAVFGVLIGDATLNPDSVNTFSLLDKGVYAVNSNFWLMNNYFSAIENSNTTSPDYGTPVFVTANNTLPCLVQVGDAQAFSDPETEPHNIFKDCRRPVFYRNVTEGNSHSGLYVANNLFSNITGFIGNESALGSGPNAVQMQGTHKNQLVIFNNLFQNIQFAGINVNNNTMLKFDVTGNRFINDASNADMVQTNYAVSISAADITAQTYGIVQKNLIENFRYLIYFNQIVKSKIISNGGTDGFMKTGTVATSNNGRAYGIWLNHCLGVDVKYNAITLANITGMTNNAQAKRGIYIVNSMNINVVKNWLSVARVGLMFDEPNYTFQIACNQFINNGFASVLFNNLGNNYGTINITNDPASVFNPPVAASENEFITNSVRIRSMGNSDLSTIYWFWNGNVGSSFDATLNGQGPAPVFSISSPNDNCDNRSSELSIDTCYSTEEICRSYMIPDTTTTETMNEDTTLYRRHEFLFKALSLNPELLNTGSASDSMFVGYYNSLLNTNIAAFNIIDSAITYRDTLLAEIVSQYITPENLDEAHQLLVNNILLNKLRTGKLANADSLLLLLIANMPLSESGVSKYKAMDMLNMIIDAANDDNSYRIADSINTEHSFKLLNVFPNPTHNVVTVMLPDIKTIAYILYQAPKVK